MGPGLTPSPEQLQSLSLRERKIRTQDFLKKLEAAGSKLFPALAKEMKREVPSRRVFWVMKVLLKRAGFFWASWKFRAGLDAVRGPDTFDWVFVLRRKTAGGTTEKICCEIGAFLQAKYCVQYLANTARPPQAKAYYFVDHTLFSQCLRQNPFLLGKRTVVRFVPSKELNRWGVREFIYPLSRASRVICEDSQAFETLLFHGIKADKAAVIEGPLEGHPNLEDYSKRLQDLL